MAHSIYEYMDHLRHRPFSHVKTKKQITNIAFVGLLTIKNLLSSSPAFFYLACCCVGGGGSNTLVSLIVQHCQEGNHTNGSLLGSQPMKQLNLMKQLLKFLSCFIEWRHSNGCRYLVSLCDVSLYDVTTRC